MKKVVALLLALVMVFSMAACAKAPAQDSSTKKPQAEGPAEQSKSNTDTKESEKPVALHLVMFGDLTPRREEYMKGEFHDKVLDELNFDLTVEFLPWSGKDVLQTMLVGGEKIAFNNTPAFTDFAQRGLCAEIPMDMITENCPEYLAMRETKGFDCASINGKIYYIPFGCKSTAGTAQFFTVRNDILKTLGYEADEIKTVDQLLEVFEAVHQAFPGMRVVSDTDVMYKMLGDSLTGELINVVEKGIYVNEYEKNDNVYSWYESEAFKAVSKFNAMLIEKGYAGKDYFTDPEKAVADWNAGNCFAKYGTASHVIENSFKATLPDAEIARIHITDAPYYSNMDFDWGMSISTADAENTENWLKLFNWMYKDQATYNFLVYGVEGKDYEFNADGTVNKLVSDVFWEDWFMMANCYQIYDPSVSKEAIEVYNNTDKDAILSKTAGFSFDSTPVSTEVALLKAAISEYMQPILLGYSDYDENFANALQQLKDAGLDAVIEEYQRQFSAWYAAK